MSAKTFSVSYFFGFVALLLIGCQSTRSDADVIKTSAQIGGSLGAPVMFEVKRASANTYEILAYGTAATDQQVLEGWLLKANQLAAGRPYEREMSKTNYEYNDAGPLVGGSSTRRVGAMVRGRILIK